MRARQLELVVKYLPTNAGDAKGAGSIPGSGRSPGWEVTTHSSILAWRIPWIEEPGRLQSIALYRVARNSSDLAYTTSQLQSEARSATPRELTTKLPIPSGGLIAPT